VSAICSSQNVQTVLDISPFVSQHLGCHVSNCITGSCTKFHHSTNPGTEYLLLYTAPKEKIQFGYTAEGGVKRLVHPHNPFGKVLFREPAIVIPQAGRKHLAEGVTSAVLQIDQAYSEDLYCSGSALERRKVQ
jgi:hypothetical protein